MNPGDFDVKKFVKFWLPPVIWMAIMFPVGNKYLGSSWIYRIVVSIYFRFFPDASYAQADVVYMIFRKSLHFIEYGVLAYLLFRAIRGQNRKAWRLRWGLVGGGIAVVYGFLDEWLQSFVPNRRGSALDWAIDTAGVLATLSLVGWIRTRGHHRGFPKALFLKRPFDVALSSFGLILSSPLWLLIAVLIKLQDRGPVFYKQERVGKKGRVFKAMKFRSMVVDAETRSGPVQAVENDPRVTRLGRVMRATAMDELPQLLNIFKGDMSFVGPRALRPNEKEVHGDPDTRAIEEIPGYPERHAVRPGLTGLTQVFLPGDTPRRRKFRYDLLYIRKMSFWLDIKLIVLSFWITFRGKWESRTDKV